MSGGIWTPNDNAPYTGLNPSYSERAYKHLLLVPDSCAVPACQNRVPYYLVFAFDQPGRGSLKSAFVCPKAGHKQNAIEHVRKFSEPISGIWYEIELTGMCCAPQCPNTAYRYGMYVEGTEILGGELCLAHDILNSGTPRTTADWQTNRHKF